MSIGNNWSQLAVGHILNVTLAPVQGTYFFLVKVNTHDLEASLGESNCQWQTDVTQPDNAYLGLSTGKLIQ
jgi:hypothetical protein